MVKPSQEKEKKKIKIEEPKKKEIPKEEFDGVLKSLLATKPEPIKRRH